MSLYHSAQNCEILGSHNSVTEHWSLHGCDTVSVGNGAWHSEGLWGLHFHSQALLSFKISGTTHLTTGHHISEDSTPQWTESLRVWLNWLHCSEKHGLAIHICYYDCIITCPARRKSDINFQMGSHKPLWVVLSTHSPCREVPWLTLWAAES